MREAADCRPIKMLRARDDRARAEGHFTQQGVARPYQNVQVNSAAYLPQSKRLLEQVSEVIRYKHYSLKTEKAYLY